MESLPDDLHVLILAHADRRDLAPLLWVSRRWRRNVKAHLHRRLWPRLESQLHASLLAIESPRARDHRLVRYACHLYTPCSSLHPPGRYRCARCSRPCDHVAACSCRPLSTLVRRALVAPCLATALVAFVLSLPVGRRRTLTLAPSLFFRR